MDHRTLPRDIAVRHRAGGHNAPTDAAAIPEHRGRRPITLPADISGPPPEAPVTVRPVWRTVAPQRQTDGGLPLVRVLAPGHALHLSRAAREALGGAHRVRVDVSPDLRRLRLLPQPVRGWALAAAGYVGGPRLQQALRDAGVPPGHYAARALPDGGLEIEWPRP